MLHQDDSNTIFQIASSLINDTARHVFLTGKAGTGKTTFLRAITSGTRKNTVVVAPTGVAAINAGGVTMHSFFQLPRGMFSPVPVQREGLMGYADIIDRHSLFKNIHFNANKRTLLQELELLIIDEVSMMRCDMLDAIDTVLRHFRRTPHIPFGGVQVLYIGDMFQLPPVASQEEWSVLKKYYDSPFFFSAHVIKDAQPLYIELKKVYRQSEQDFIDILNRIRNNSMQRSDYDFLNRKYDPGFLSPPDDHYITITTHNKKADAINAAELEKLSGREHSFQAVVKDEFSDKAYPAEFELKLKVGAQVMFVKNDPTGERRYFNGKLAIIKKISNDQIWVSFDDGADDLEVPKETWENLRYIYNREDQEVDEEVIGSFTQYPLRLAWAITVHKSQGLTFNKAIIDAGASFAPGQVYVALSRCASLDGLVLRSKIHPGAVATDERIVRFAQQEIGRTEELEQLLENEKYKFWALNLVRAFDWQKLVTALHNWVQLIPEVRLPDTPATLQMSKSLLSKAGEQSSVAQKFQRQLEQILAKTEQTKDTTQLEDRMNKAIRFFFDAIIADILQPIRDHYSVIRYASRINKYKEEVRVLELAVWSHIERLTQTQYGALRFIAPDHYHEFNPQQQETSQKKASKENKGASQQVSFDLFQEGKTVEEIAALRNLAVSTIETHLAPYVKTGQITAQQLVPAEKIARIQAAISEVGESGTTAIKNKLGDQFSYHEVRVVIYGLAFQRKQEPASSD